MNKGEEYYDDLSRSRKNIWYNSVSMLDTLGKIEIGGNFLNDKEHPIKKLTENITFNGKTLKHSL